jgi:integrase
MAIFKRGGVYYYEFVYDGVTYKKSTKVKDAQVAKDIEAAFRVALAQSDGGIQKKKKAPTLAGFAPDFERAIETECAEKQVTVDFYKEKLQRLLEDAKLPGLRLDQIKTTVIDDYKERRTRQDSRFGTPMSPASVNRELATLRRLLRLAESREVITRAPKVKMLAGERTREFVLSHRDEPKYLESCPQPLKDVALLTLDTGLRPGEAADLELADVRLEPAVHAKYGYIKIRKGKTKNAKRNLSLTPRAAEMLKRRKASAKGKWVFEFEGEEPPMRVTSLDHQHDDVRTALKLSKEFVVYSLRHSMLTRLGESGAGAFDIMKIAGHASVTTSQRYVHPTPEGLERAFERLQDLNTVKFLKAEDEAKAEAVGAVAVPPNFRPPKKRAFVKSEQIVEFKRTGP